jgi:RNA polymerase primary sigma factor
MRSKAVHRSRGSLSEDSLSTYLREINAYPLFSPGEERAVADRVKAGDAAAFEQLVCANLRFVVSVAKKYEVRGVALADLVDEGNLGLIRAVKRFDPSQGVRFITYAIWWIRQAVLQALAEQSHVVRVPFSRAATLRRVRRHAGALRQRLGREPTSREIAVGTDLTGEEVADTLTVRSDLSLDGAPATGDGRLLDYLPDDHAPAPDEGLLDDALRSSIEHAFAGLKGREARVLRLYFGFDGNEPITLEDIGAMLGVTGERARQIKDKALARIRRSRLAPELASFLVEHGD